jgi:hypothetical protein
MWNDSRKSALILPWNPSNRAPAPGGVGALGFNPCPSSAFRFLSSAFSDPLTPPAINPTHFPKSYYGATPQVETLVDLRMEHIKEAMGHD